LAVADANGGVVPANRVSRKWARFPAARAADNPTRGVEITASVYGINRGATSVNRAGIDAELLTGLALLRHSHISPFSKLACSIATTRLTEEVLHEGARVAVRHIPVAQIRRFFESRIGEPMIIRWRKGERASLQELLRTPASTLISISAS
jgi:hypothetical protein